MDESRCQNVPNVQRALYEPGTKNEIKKTSF